MLPCQRELTSGLRCVLPVDHWITQRLEAQTLNQTSSIGKVVHQRGDELIWCLSLDRSTEVQRLCAFWERHEDALRLRATFAMLLRERFACAAIHCLSFIDVTRTVHPAARDTLIFAATPITPTSGFSHGKSIEMGLS